MLTTDYLIIGSGTAGMSFADQLLTDTNATIGIIDRHHMPGGHWNDAYSFVRLHQPSAFYGVGSRQLGSNRIDVSSLNRGYYELASGPEIVSYFDRLMQERFLPSGRVQYFPMCDHLGDGRFVSLVSGTIQQVAFSKRLCARYVLGHPGALDAHPLLSSCRRRQTRNAQPAADFRARAPTLRYLGRRQNSDGCRNLAAADGRSAGKYPMDRTTRFLGAKSRRDSARRRLFRAHSRRNGRQVGGGGRSHLGRGSLRAAGTKRSDVTHRSDCAADRCFAAPRSRSSKWKR